ncbi:MAG: glycosyltransferase family 39 protein [Bacteroidia bacterium]
MLHADKYLSRPKQYVLGFTLVFLFHLFFKSLFLDHAGFWYDETFGLWYSQQDWGLIKHTSEWDLNPPLYYYFLWIWRNLFGISEFSIRFSSVLFSSLAAGVLYLFSVKYFNKITAFVTLLLYTCSADILFFSHEARCYSLVLFLAVCSSYLFFELLVKKNTFFIVLLGITNFFLVYTHYLAGFILLAQLFIALLNYKESLTKQIGVAFAISIVLGLWRFTRKTITLIFHHEKSFWLSRPALSDLKDLFFDFFNGKYVFLFYAILLIFSLIFFFLKNKPAQLERTQKTGLLYLLLCGFVTVLACFFMSLLFPMFLKRYLLFTAPFMFVLIGYLISKLNKTMAYIASGIVCILSIYGFSNLNLKTLKPMDYRNAMMVVKKIESPKTVILVETKDIGALFAYYYDKEIFKDYYHMEERMNKKNIFFVSTPEDVQAIDLNKFNSAILTQSFEDVNPSDKALQAFISGKFRKKIEQHYFKGVNILAYSNN